MSVCGQSGQTEEDSASEEVGVPSATRDIYKQKPASKVVRVLTVLAYLLSVSLAAILLSVYYICVWKSPGLPLEAHTNDTGGISARRAPRMGYRHADQAAQTPSYIHGGGDTTINGDMVHSPPENITSGTTEDNVSTEPTTDVTLNTSAMPDTTLALHNGTSDDSSTSHTDSIT